MDVREALRRLESLGTAQNRRVYARHGVQAPCFGVSYANQGKLTKEIGTDHSLAVALWSSGNHDARVLATTIADPEKLDRRTLDEWVKQCDSYVITDALSALVARCPQAKVCGLAWARSGQEFVASCGWNVVGVLASRSAHLSEEECERLLVQIEQGIHGAPNRARHSMNQALIGIGSRPSMTELAVAAADRIGVVDVDHGETSCKTPDARSYIEKMIAYHKARAERNGEPWPPPVPGRKKARRKKAAARKPAATKAKAATKPAGKKAAARKAAAKPASAKKATGKKAATKKVAASKATAKKAAPKKATAKKATAKKVAGKKAAARKAPAKKATAEKASPKKATAKKATTKKATTKKASGSKAAAKKSPAAKPAAKKVSPKAAARSRGRARATSRA